MNFRLLTVVFISFTAFSVYAQSQDEDYYKARLKNECIYTSIGAGYSFETIAGIVSKPKIPTLMAEISWSKKFHFGFGITFLSNNNKLFYNTNDSQIFSKYIDYRYNLYHWKLDLAYKLRTFRVNKSVFNLFVFVYVDNYLNSLINVSHIDTGLLQSNQHYFFRQMLSESTFGTGIYLDKKVWFKNNEFILRISTCLPLTNYYYTASSSANHYNNSNSYRLVPYTPIEISLHYNIFPVNTVNPLKLRLL